MFGTDETHWITVWSVLYAQSITQSGILTTDIDHIVDIQSLEYDQLPIAVLIIKLVQITALGNSFLETS